MCISPTIPKGWNLCIVFFGREIRDVKRYIHEKLFREIGTCGWWEGVKDDGRFPHQLPSVHSQPPRHHVRNKDTANNVILTYARTLQIRWGWRMEMAMGGRGNVCMMETRKRNFLLTSIIVLNCNFSLEYKIKLKRQRIYVHVRSILSHSLCAFGCFIDIYVHNFISFFFLFCALTSFCHCLCHCLC